MSLLTQMYPRSTKGELCGLFGNSRQAWYDSQKRHASTEMQEVFILKLTRELRKEHKRMGVKLLKSQVHRTGTGLQRGKKGFGISGG